MVETKRGEEQPMFLEKGRIIPILEEIKRNEDQEKASTIQVQINIKGHDSKGGNKISKEIAFPHKVRKADKIFTFADESHVQECKDGNIPYALIEDLIGEEKKKRRTDILKKNSYFILCQGYNKVLQLKDILRRGDTPYIVKGGDKLNDVFEAAKRSYKIRVKDLNVTSFPAGHTGMPAEHTYENIKTGIVSLIPHLKKGWQSLGGVFIKTEKTKPTVLY